MPEPRNQRPRTTGARKGSPPRADAPDADKGLEPVVPPVPDTASDAAEHLEPGDAASAEAEAEALAAGDVAGEDGAGARAAPTGADDEAIGWFRDESIDEGAEPEADDRAGGAGAAAAAAAAAAGAPAAAAAPAQPAEAYGQEAAGIEPEAAGVEPVEPGDEQPIVRERDRAVVTPVAEAPPPPRRSRLRGILIGIVTILAVAAVGFVAGLMLPTILPGPGVDTTPPPTAAASEVPSPTSAPTPAATPAPTPAPTPTPKPTAAPTPAPTQVTYVVKTGDQLARIAARYGVTVKAIQEANGIKDPNLITVGQRLVIPAPAKTPRP